MLARRAGGLFYEWASHDAGLAKLTILLLGELLR